MLANRYTISHFIPERCLFLKYPNHNKKWSKIFFSFIYLLAGSLELVLKSLGRYLLQSSTQIPE